MTITVEPEQSRDKLLAELDQSQKCVSYLQLQLEHAHRDAQTVAAATAAAAVEREHLLQSERASRNYRRTRARRMNSSQTCRTSCARRSAPSSDGHS